MLGTFGCFSGNAHPLTLNQNASHLLSQAVITLRTQAEKTAIIADFMKDTAKVDPLTTRKSLWNQAIENAFQTVRGWGRTAERCSRGKAQAPDVFQSWWEQELQNATSELALWTSKLEAWEKIFATMRG